MMGIPFEVLLGAILAGKVIFLFLGWQVWRSHRRGYGFSQPRMIGLSGKAVTDIVREGRVMVQGEYWNAQAREWIAAGENIRVTAINGMLLEVEPLPDKALTPRQVSAVTTADTDIQRGR